ncbi:hypothetical protein VKT23_006590 [Stygiomarasmius scandens]|uniref:Transmembrane protein n=1 Tax=Marasmiellus scandens TaxID=2682957 RepID=A0ABR1JN65_9AGAR
MSTRILDTSLVPSLLAHLSLIINVCSQIYLFTIKKHEISSSFYKPAYSPHPIFLYTASIFQALLQLWWLLKLPRIRQRAHPAGDIESSSLFSPLPLSGTAQMRSTFLDQHDSVKLDQLTPSLTSSHPLVHAHTQWHIPGANTCQRQCPRLKRTSVIQQMHQSSNSKLEVPAASYIPYYILGNICFATWTFTYTSSHLSLSQLALYIGSVAQFYAIFFVLKRPFPSSRPAAYHHAALEKRSVDCDTYENDGRYHSNTTALETKLLAAISPYPASFQTDALTTFVAKVSAGLTGIWFWLTWGAVEVGMRMREGTITPSTPTSAQQLNVGFCLLLLTIASGPDPTLGMTFIFMLLSLYFGSPSVPSSSSWQTPMPIPNPYNPSRIYANNHNHNSQFILGFDRPNSPSYSSWSTIRTHVRLHCSWPSCVESDWKTFFLVLGMILVVVLVLDPVCMRFTRFVRTEEGDEEIEELEKGEKRVLEVILEVDEVDE